MSIRSLPKKPATSASVVQHAKVEDERARHLRDGAEVQRIDGDVVGEGADIGRVVEYRVAKLVAGCVTCIGRAGRGPARFQHGESTRTTEGHGGRVPRTAARDARGLRGAPWFSCFLRVKILPRCATQCSPEVICSPDRQTVPINVPCYNSNDRKAGLLAVLARPSRCVSPQVDSPQSWPAAEAAPPLPKMSWGGHRVGRAGCFHGRHTGSNELRAFVVILLAD